MRAASRSTALLFSAWILTQAGCLEAPPAERSPVYSDGHEPGTGHGLRPAKGEGGSTGGQRRGNRLERERGDREDDPDRSDKVREDEPEKDRGEKYGPRRRSRPRTPVYYA